MSLGLAGVAGRKTSGGAGGGGGGFDPASIFAVAANGGWYEMADTDTLFEDLTGTIPAAVDGLVGFIADKSGNGNSLAAGFTSTRPTLRSANGVLSLEFDGSNDNLIRNSVVYGDGPITICAAFSKAATDANTRTLVALNDNSNPGGALRLDGDLIQLRNRGPAQIILNATGGPYPTPSPAYLIVTAQLSKDGPVYTKLRVNGADQGESTSDPGISSYGTQEFRFGAETSFPVGPFRGFCAGLLWWVGVPTTEQIEGAEAYLATLI